MTELDTVDLESEFSMDKTENNPSLSSVDIPSDPEQSIENKLEKNRERNREHAKRTRLRKKEMIEGMKMRLLELQREASRLEQLLEESNTANILLALHKPEEIPHDVNPGRTSSAAHSLASLNEEYDRSISVPKGNIIDQLRHKVRAEAARTFRSKYEHQTQLLAGARERALSTSTSEDYMVPSIVRMDSAGGESMEGDVSGGEQLQGTDEEHQANASAFSTAVSTSWLDGKEIQDHSFDIGSKMLSPGDQKRERNRMHAKLTRDRKKLFTSRMQQTIQALERHNQLMRNRLNSLISGSVAASCPNPEGAINVLGGAPPPAYFPMTAMGRGPPVSLTGVPFPGPPTFHMGMPPPYSL